MIIAKWKVSEIYVPDVDGGVRQDLAIAVPAAVGGSTATSWVVSADMAEDLPFAVLLQVQLQVRVTLAVTGCEAETPHPVHLNEGQVKLVTWKTKKKQMGGMWTDEGKWSEKQHLSQEYMKHFMDKTRWYQKDKSEGKIILI